MDLERRAMLPRLARRTLSLASLLTLTATLGLTSASCKDDEAREAQAQSDAPSAIGAGETQVQLDAAGVTLTRGGEALLRLPLGGLQLGLVDAIDASFNYDPYPLYEKVPLYSPPDDLRWSTLSGIEVKSGSATKAELALSFDGGERGTLSIEQSAEGSFEATFAPEQGARRVVFIKLLARASADEAFYGLGEYFDDVNHRGKVRAMQIEVDNSIESSYNEVHVPVPFVIGTKAWGLFVESALPMAFSLGREESDLVEVAVGAGPHGGEPLTFRLFADKHPLDVTKHYYDVTGYPKLPARWALGPWVWRDENKDQAEVENDLQTIRALDLATTGIWIDRPYARAVNTFDFDPAMFPDAQGMIDKLHAYGFRTALWHTPYLDEKAPETAAAFSMAKQKGYYPPQAGPSLNKWGPLIDLTNPEAFGYWQSQIRKYTDMGVEGFKLDYGEDIVPGIGGIRTPWKFFDGSDELTMHSRFQLFYHRAYAETMPEGGGFLLCRHATVGDQKNGIIIWPGDLDATFAHHREQVPKEGGGQYSAVGGLPASLIAGLSLGPSGFPFYGADTGGYKHSPPDKELFIRWFEQTALSTVMQIGTSSNTVAWEPEGGPGFDDELLDYYRIYTRLHLRLFPYEWTYAENLAKDGRAITRPLGLAYPELGVHPNDAYMFGDDLLVAPVVERDKRARDVSFPQGRWVDWWTGEIIEGGKTVEVKAPLGVLPLFVRESGIVPLLRPTIDTLAPTTKPDEVDSYATSAGVLWARIALGAASRFVLFDGAEISQERVDGEARLSTKDGAEFRAGAVLELLASAEPGAVTDNGAPLSAAASLNALTASAAGFFFDKETSSLFIKVSAGEHAVVVKP